MKLETTTTYIIEARSSETGWGEWERASAHLAEAKAEMAKLSKHFDWIKFRLVKRTTTTKILEIYV